MSRDYRREYDNYQGKPDQIANRSKRNTSRRLKQEQLGYKLTSKQHVDHKDGNPKNTSAKNLRVRSEKANTSDNKQSKRRNK
tara:strand:+ start:968 stop:1213 length:246 start_codon:yes stop_codon:yes gene_type:complete